MARILIVDDEPNMRRILGALLREDRHAVTEAAGVREAVAAIGAARLDLVITDQKMRDGEGLEVLAASKDEEGRARERLLSELAHRPEGASAWLHLCSMSW